MEGSNSLASRDHWEESWQAAAPVQVIAENDAYFGRNGIFVRVMRRQIGKIENLRVVELGGARSLFLLALAKWWGCEVTAVDYSPAGIEQTEAMFAANGCKVHTVGGDMFAWRPEAGSFDLVTHWGVMEHFPDTVPLMKLCRSLVSPAGHVVFSMPNLEAWGARLWKRWSPKDYAIHIHHSDKAVREACEATGLRLSSHFFWGPWMLSLRKWERTGMVQSVVDVIQQALNAPNRVIPMYHHGLRRMSQHRGFVAVPINHDQNEHHARSA